MRNVECGMRAWLGRANFADLISTTKPAFRIPQSNNPMVYIEIIDRGAIPGKNLTHPVSLQLTPQVAVVIDHQRLIELLYQPIRRIVVKLIAVSTPGPPLEISDRIV